MGCFGGGHQDQCRSELTASDGRARDGVGPTYHSGPADVGGSAAGLKPASLGHRPVISVVHAVAAPVSGAAFFLGYFTQSDDARQVVARGIMVDDERFLRFPIDGKQAYPALFIGLHHGDTEGTEKNEVMAGNGSACFQQCVRFSLPGTANHDDGILRVFRLLRVLRDFVVNSPV